MNRIEDYIDVEIKKALLAFREGLREVADGAYNSRSIGTEGRTIPCRNPSIEEAAPPDVPSHQ